MARAIPLMFVILIVLALVARCDQRQAIQCSRTEAAQNSLSR